MWGLIRFSKRKIYTPDYSFDKQSTNINPEDENKIHRFIPFFGALLNKIVETESLRNLKKNEHL